MIGWKKVKDTSRSLQKDVRDTRDKAIYGQDEAKRSIEHILGQWLTGEPNGYCFGFEGPPGTGKTSIAKDGICKILKDEKNNPRPFSFIPLGGSSHGSFLEGHGYTYAGGTWGQMVNILTNSKCMNPIIFIDELDKVSQTEHGKEIIGILIHMTDPTQNHEFMDKYFADIPLDLSKAIFIFSYNDASLIDPILRERIHRVKFKPFREEEKISICQKYILPKLYKQVGFLPNDIQIKPSVLEFIISNYTYDAGMRRITQLLLEILRELNVRSLHSDSSNHMNISVKIPDVYDDLLKHYTKCLRETILDKPRIGSINGLYATHAGTGGITRIEMKLCSSLSQKESKFITTGNLGKVMNESITVAQTVVSQILNDTAKSKIETKKHQDYHLHCNHGGTPKDGPSAGAAITLTMLSCLLEIPISHKIGITGEIDVNGHIHAIGGLESKIWGAQKAGVQIVFYPSENEEDVIKIKKETWFSKEMKLVRVSHILDTDLLSQVFTQDISTCLIEI